MTSRPISSRPRQAHLTIIPLTTEAQWAIQVVQEVVEVDPWVGECEDVVVVVGVGVAQVALLTNITMVIMSTTIITHHLLLQVQVIFPVSLIMSTVPSAQR